MDRRGKRLSKSRPNDAQMTPRGKMKTHKSEGGCFSQTEPPSLKNQGAYDGKATWS